MSQKLYVAIPYARKNELKASCRLNWDADKKMWYTTSESTYNRDILKPYHIVDLTIPWVYKNASKALGAKWNGSNWYVTKELYEANLASWTHFQHQDEPDTQVEK